MVSLNVSSLDLGPTVRFQRLYKFFGDQLYNNKHKRKKARWCIRTKREIRIFNKRTMQGSDLLRLSTFLLRMVDVAAVHKAGTTHA